MLEKNIVLLKNEYNIDKFCDMAIELEEFDIVDCTIGFDHDLLILGRKILEDTEVNATPDPVETPSESGALEPTSNKTKKYQFRIVHILQCHQPLPQESEQDLSFALFDIHIDQDLNMVRAFDEHTFLLVYTGSDSEQADGENKSFIISPLQQEIIPVELPENIQDIQIAKDKTLWLAQSKYQLTKTPEQPVLIAYDKDLKPVFELAPKKSLSNLMSVDALNVSYQGQLNFSGGPHYPMIHINSSTDQTMTYWHSPLSHIHRVARLDRYLLVDAGDDRAYQFLLLELDDWGITKILLEITFQETSGRNIQPEFTYARDEFLVLLQGSQVYWIALSEIIGQWQSVARQVETVD